MGSSNSSPDRAGQADGLIHHDADDRVSPVRLPRRGRASFVETFNRLYQSMGWTLHMNELPLEQRQCQACEGGVDPMGPADVEQNLQALENWQLSSDGHSIERCIHTGNFQNAVDHVRWIADLAEHQQHHPDLHLTGYRHLRIVLTTHAIGGLSENDFIVAARIDQGLRQRAQ